MHAPSRQHPPAPFGFHDYLDRLGRLPALEARPLSLRLHFPALAGEADAAGALATYLAYLKREAAMHAVLFTGMSTIRQLAFDGMAPCLGERQLAGLLAYLHEHFRFMPDETGDYEAVVDPEAPPERLARLRRQGFNRLRFDLPGSPDDIGDLAGLVDAARAAGYRSVGVALGFGLPGQDFGLLRRMLEVVLGAAPDRILLCHRPGDGVPDAIAPGGVAQRMQQLCLDRIDMAGYTALGGGCFALLPGDPGGAPRAMRGGQPQARGTHLLGCGLAAFGAVGPVCWQNAVRLEDYYALLDRNEVPVAMHMGQTRPYLMQVKDFQDADQ